MTFEQKELRFIVQDFRTLHLQKPMKNTPQGETGNAILENNFDTQYIFIRFAVLKEMP